MRTLHINTDPDGNAPRSVTLPSIWGDNVAQALAELSPTDKGPLKLSSEAARWIDFIESSICLSHQNTAPLSNTPTTSPGRSLAGLLLMQHMAPNKALWQRDSENPYGFTLKLSSFVQENIFSLEQFVSCLELACESLRNLYKSSLKNQNNELPLFGETSSKAPQITVEKAGHILFTDLDACLAALGLDYDSDDARDFSAALLSLSRTLLYAGTAQHIPPLCHRDFPEFEEIAIASVTKYASQTDLPIIELGFSSPNPIDALLNVEACGLAPIFSFTDEEGCLRASTLHRLAQRKLSPEKALALTLTGTQPLPQPLPQAHLHMYEALAPFLDIHPTRPEIEGENISSSLERGIKRPLPARQKGFTQQASIGGHRLFMRTSEFSDGTLASLSLTPQKETAFTRGLMESLGQSVSIGLQYGAPLEAYITQFAYTNFGPCGTVEGDPSTLYASSMLDYVFRTLSETYLQHHMPDAPNMMAEEKPQTSMLPFQAEPALKHIITTKKTKRRLRLVG